MSFVKSQSMLKSINSGKKIDLELGKLDHEKYWEAVKNNKITGKYCPKLVTFNLSNLMSYLEEIEKKFQIAGISEEERGVTLLPCFHDEVPTFNLIFSPCIQDEDGNLIYPLKKSIQSNNPFNWEDFDIFNTGSPTPPPYDIPDEI